MDTHIYILTIILLILTMGVNVYKYGNKLLNIRFIGITILLFGVFGLFLFNKKSFDPGKRKQFMVTSTTKIIHDMVDYIASKHIKTNYIISGGLDPHSYEITRKDAENISKSDILFCNGLGLEGSSSLSKALRTHINTVYVGDEAMGHRKDKLIFYEGVKDPHIWLDLDIVYCCIDPITTAIIDLDPENVAYYIKRAADLKTKILASHNRAKAIIKDLLDSKKYIVTAHFGYEYFAAEYLKHDNLQPKNIANSPEGMSSFNDITIHDIQNSVDFIKKNNIKVVFAEYGMTKKFLNRIKEILHLEGYEIKISDFPLSCDMYSENITDDGPTTTAEAMVISNINKFKDALMEEVN